MDLQFCRPHLLAPLLRVCLRPLAYSVQPSVLRMRQACPVTPVQLTSSRSLKMFSFFISLCPTFLVQLTACFEQSTFHSRMTDVACSLATVWTVQAICLHRPY